VRTLSGIVVVAKNFVAGVVEDCLLCGHILVVRPLNGLGLGVGVGLVGLKTAK